MRMILELLEDRITPSTGLYLHPTQTLAAQIGSPSPGAVTMDAAGHVAAFWQGSATSAAGPVIQGEVNGSPVFTVGPAGTIDAAAADTSGDVAVVWQNVIASSPTVSYYLNLYSATGAGLAGPIHLGDGYNTWPNQSYLNAPAQASVAGDSAGHFMVVWADVNANLRGQVFDAKGNTLSSAFPIGSVPTGPAFPTSSVPSGPSFKFSPAVAADQNGGFVVLANSGQIIGQHYDALGNALGAPFVVWSNPNGYGPPLYEALSVASDGAGNLVAVWSEYAMVGDSHADWAALQGIEGQRFTDTGTLQGGVFKINNMPAPAGLPQEIEPAIAMDGAGNVEVVYSGFYPFGTYAERFNAAGHSVGALVQLNNTEPIIAGDPGGDVVFGGSPIVIAAGSNVNHAPRALTPIAAADQTAMVNTSYQESQSYFTDPDGDPLTYKATLADASPLPAWLTIDSNGRLTGTPDPIALGKTYQVKVTATDPYWASTSLVLPLTIAPDASLPNGAEFIVEPGAPFNFAPVANAVNAAGESIVVWDIPYSDNSAVMAQLYDAKHNAVGTPVQIAADPNTLMRPTVSADAAGNFDVAWCDNGTIFLRQISDKGVALGSAVQLETQAASDTAPQLAVDASGNLVLAWVKQLPGPSGASQAYVRRFDEQGNSLGAAMQVSASGDQPAVAVNPSGTILVAWDAFTQGPGPVFADTDAQVMTQLFDARLNPVTNPTVAGLAAESAGVAAGDPAVAADGLGNFAVAWISPGPAEAGNAIGVERLNHLGTSLGTTGLSPIGDSTSAGVAADGNGNFTVTWQGAGIYGQRYNGAGQPVGGIFRVDSFFNAASTAPVIASDAAGDLLIARVGSTGNIVAHWYWPTPTVHVPTAQSVGATGALPFSTATGNAITLTGGDPTHVETLTIGTAGTLTVTHNAGLASMTGNGTGKVTLTGKLAALNGALQGLTFHATTAAPTADVLVTLTPNTAISVSGDVPILVHRNVPPTVTLPANPPFVVAGSTLTFTAVNAITIADADAGSSLGTLTLWVTTGTLKLGSTAGLTVKGNGTGLLRVTGTLSRLNAALNGMVYTPALGTNIGTATLNAYVVDSGNAMGWGSTILTIIQERPMPPVAG
jgi:hypothetical protein